MSAKPNSGQDSALGWLRAVYDYRRSTPNEALFSYFRADNKQDDLTLPVVNLVTAACKAVFGTSCGKASGSELDPSTCAAYLYYMVAESILQQLFPREAQEETAAAKAQQRFKGLVKPHNPPACRKLVSSQEFHMPLIECALQLVYVITSHQEREDPSQVSELLQRKDRGALLWLAARSFAECFGPSSTLPMPAQLQGYLARMQEELLQAHIFQSGSVMYEVLTTGGGCHFQPGDMTLATNIITAYAAKAVQQTQEVAWQLQQDSADHDNNFHEQAAWLMDKVILHHLDLCFGVHMSVVVACVVYVSGKVLQAPMPFSAIVQVLTSKLEHTPDMLRRDSDTAVHVLQNDDLRAFYNSRFLDAVQGSVRSYLQQYKDWTAQHHNTAATSSSPATGPVHTLAADDVPQAGPACRNSLPQHTSSTAQQITHTPSQPTGQAPCQPAHTAGAVRAALKAIQAGASPGTAKRNRQRGRHAQARAAANDKENDVSRTSIETTEQLQAGGSMSGKQSHSTRGLAKNVVPVMSAAQLR